jgi:large subunit ribosomal protein L24e
MRERLTCIVCGRKFPRGQGVVLKVGGKEYPFHSKACALKFLRRVVEEVDQDMMKKVFDTVESEFREELRLRAEKTAKKIA